MAQKQAGDFWKYLAAVLLFGSNGVVASAITLDSYEIVLLRTGIGCAAMLAILFAAGHRLTCLGAGRSLAWLALSGLVMGVHWMFLYEAYAQVGVGIATLLCYCGPVLVLALSPLLFRERLGMGTLLGFAAVLAGLVLVSDIGPGADWNPFGVFCGLMSAVLYAGMVVCNKKAAAIQGLEKSALQLLFGFLAVAVYVGLRQGLALTIRPEDWLPILLLGLVNTGLGSCWYFSAMGRLPVQTVSIVGYLEPVSAVAFGALFLGERLTPAQLLGAVLILGGAAFAEKMRRPCA